MPSRAARKPAIFGIARIESILRRPAIPPADRNDPSRLGLRPRAARIALRVERVHEVVVVVEVEATHELLAERDPADAVAERVEARRPEAEAEHVRHDD